MAFDSKVPPQAWAEEAFKGRIGYILCTNDQAIPTFVQSLFMEKSGVEWDVKELASGHSPFLNKTKEVVNMVEAWTNKWTT